MARIRHCPPIQTQARMDKIMAVGFGCAQATRDGRMVADGEQGVMLIDGKLKRVDEFITFGDIEAFAVADPDHDWRIILHGPLHGETYQRQGVGVWLCIERNEGFA